MSGVGKSSEKQQHEPASKIPAGLETLYTIEKDNVKSSLGVLILAVHWSIVRAGLRIPLKGEDKSSSSNNSNNDKKYTERLPLGWSNETPNSPTAVFTYDYVDPCNPAIKYQLKVIEIVRDVTAVVTVSRMDSVNTSTSQSSVAGTSSSGSGQASSSSDQAHKTAASTFQLPNFIRYDPDKLVQNEASAESVFYKAEELEKQIWTELMEPLGLKVIGLPPFQGPYDDKVKTEARNEESAQRQTNIIHHDDPLRDDRFPRGGGGPMPYGPGIPRAGPPPAGPAGGFNPLFGPPFGGGGLGRSDLDPLGGIGAGMIADPRGFRTPRIGPPGRLPPGAVPPGARFDPFGPPNPNPHPTGPGPNWAVPNPDEPPPPGFDDMFM